MENRAAWFCIHTRSRHEDAVYQRFLEKRLVAFFPKMETWSRRKDRRKKIQKPLFAGYLFVYEHLNAQCGLEILKTPGVVRILGNKDGPQPIPQIQIESIQKILNGKSAVSPFPYLKEGQLVRVIDGPLRGCEGFLLKKKEEKETLIVSIDLLNRSLSVEITGANIEPAT